ncbi:ligase-associated DNA damage response DEXH box helicase [Oharaeibacter diazotrophicus]|uniref:ATP-dependent Lhr-like helicase n=1 Tax=Oharaeibacter diazotrophicus TaxID=1920512 RepID=A0A4R6RBI5_9HYPH|nr:ligase-associated DNA damage response DEXH box helicase [Oharaeibacter diazotrophicus]TDP83503.1 ATP-dependent Lhr-like helicase [Oharaeibacter diazotrophicus]BBE72336.1 ATP-dependent RNA helicase RhlE [Pleomorphomonas sp. SM30]GLS79106.1 DNA ligase-associated DEXH box helicase [Oharaeibacter diazotrophicus]
MTDAAPPLPPRFAAWFAARGWAPRPHQLALLAHARAGRSSLLIAPTGAGKTLAGFLPSLIDLSARPKWKPGTRRRGVHTLYVSPLKALAVDVERNLGRPVAEMALPVDIETRTGDTSASRRQRQKLAPPDILMTTPEQLALLIAAKDAESFFADLSTVILDELHALVTSKRGDLLALGLARLRALAPPGLRTVGLSATVAEPDQLRAWLVPQAPGAPTALADLVVVEGGARPEITILETDERVPWAGHSARWAIPAILAAIAAHKLTLVFVNTRSQAEMLFAELWKANDDGLPIAVHHGSLDVGQRRRVEAAMAAGSLAAVVATSTLDLGIDWGDVDLVIHVGAPKGASRLAQRIGRANHRMDEPSKAILVPANRFEVLECRAALDANYLGAQDTPPIRDGALDVLAQHVLGRAVAGPFRPEAFHAEVVSAYPYRHLDRDGFDRVVDFVATGGYALRTYERYAKIKATADGSFRLTHPRFAQQYRLNVGTIVEAPLLKVRLGGRARGVGPLRGGRVLGEIEEYFCETMSAGDTFLFAGEVLRYEGIRENEVIVTRAPAEEARIPVYAGGKFPLSTFLADGVRRMLADPAEWSKLPRQVADWLEIQRAKSVLPRRDQLLIETFPRAGRFHMVAYPFEGRLAHQTLGMLLTRRLERLGARPMGFVATDYSLAVWALSDLGHLFATGAPSPEALFDPDMLGDDLDAWMAESYLLKRTFRACALISGLVERNHPGEEKSGRQVTVSTDLIYDVLRRHEPDHVLMRATWADAATGLLDLSRLSDMLSRIGGRIVHKRLERISPLAVPIMLEIGRERVAGDGEEALLREAADDLVAEAMA